MVVVQGMGEWVGVCVLGMGDLCVYVGVLDRGLWKCGFHRCVGATVEIFGVPWKCVCGVGEL